MVPWAPVLASLPRGRSVQAQIGGKFLANLGQFIAPHVQVRSVRPLPGAAMRMETPA
jgi:hypothetical protein